MNNNKVQKPALLGALVTLGLVASSSAAIDATAFTTEITSAATSMETVLTAGAVIIGAFFVWKILKRALNKSA